MGTRVMLEFSVTFIEQKKNRKETALCNTFMRTRNHTKQAKLSVSLREQMLIDELRSFVKQTQKVTSI